MRVVSINGSMRKNRVTDQLLHLVIKELGLLDDQLQVNSIQISEMNIHPCRVVCSNFCSTHPYQCIQQDDLVSVLDQIVESDLLLIGSPLYFRGPPAKFQAFLERLISIFFFYESQGDTSAVPHPLAGKPVGLVATAEYSNPHQILEYLHDFCTILRMKPVILDKFPYLGAAAQGDLEKDTIFAYRTLAQQLALGLINAVCSH
jgi:multimeric flavodoxin WrbA